jgi:hypothetical protein
MQSIIARPTDFDYGPIEGQYFPASYTQDAYGNLSTTSSSDNMPDAIVSKDLDITTVSISPSSNLLAAGGLQDSRCSISMGQPDNTI